MPRAGSSNEPDLILLEVGPGQTLSVVRAPAAPARRGPAVLSSLRHPRQEISDEVFMRPRARAGVGGGRKRRLGGRARRAAAQASRCPTYPFDHERYWIERGCRSPSPRQTQAHRPAALRRSGRARQATLRECLGRAERGRRRDRTDAGRTGRGPAGLDPERPERHRAVGPRPVGELRRPRLRLAVPHPGERAVPQAVRRAHHVPSAIRGGSLDRLARGVHRFQARRRTHFRRTSLG